MASSLLAVEMMGRDSAGNTALLDNRLPSAVEPLRVELEKRQSQFQTVFHVVAPFDETRKTFGLRAVRFNEETASMRSIPRGC